MAIWEKLGPQPSVGAARSVQSFIDSSTCSAYLSGISEHRLGAGHPTRYWETRPWKGPACSIPEGVYNLWGK